MSKKAWRRYLADQISGFLAAAMKRRLLDDLTSEVSARIEDAIKQRLLEQTNTDMKSYIEDVLSQRKPWKLNLWVPSLRVAPKKSDGIFMTHSTCSARDFFHPDFSDLCNMLALEPIFHRKYWEWIFIIHHLRQHGLVGPGRRGLGFGVGAEPLSSALAKYGCKITATDAPEAIGVAQGWKCGGEYAESIDDLHKPEIIDRDTFLARVSYAACDMNNIDQRFREYDFCWSSCCLEHLGDLSKGQEFIVKSVENTLKVGGIAVHTTEFNLSSNEDTVSSGPTVLYRRRDVEDIIHDLRQRGHIVSDLSLAPDAHVLDFYVDTPPYSCPPHLKLHLLGYTSTSIGLVIRRGR